MIPSLVSMRGGGVLKGINYGFTTAYHNKVEIEYVRPKIKKKYLFTFLATLQRHLSF